MSLIENTFQEIGLFDGDLNGDWQLIGTGDVAQIFEVVINGCD